MTYQVIGHPRTRTMRVYWMLEELEQDYEALIAKAHSDAARTANPSGKVPALVTDGHAISDSTAILQFLADRHGALTYPCGTVERAKQDSLTQFACDEIDGSLWNASKHRTYYPEEHRVEAAISGAKYDFANAMKTLSTRLGDNEFITGNTLTVPDIILAHCAGWAKTAGFEMPKGNVADYFKRMRSRRAFKMAKVRSAKLM